MISPYIIVFVISLTIQANAFSFKDMKVRLPESTHLLLTKTKTTTTELHAMTTSINRRDFIVAGIASTAASPLIANAVQQGEVEGTTTNTNTNSNTTTKPRFTSAQIQKFLQPIPTFAIVDKTGTPYMVVGEDAKLSAYFFTSYTEANRILSAADKSASKALKEAFQEENDKRRASGTDEKLKLKLLTKDEADDVIGINPWKLGSARISSVPMDFAAGLAFKGKVKGAYFRIAPAEQDVLDAIDIDKVDDLAEGKVPLFYFEDFELGLKDGEELWSGVGNGSGSGKSSGSSEGTKKKIPLYFSKGQLLQEYKKMNPKVKKEDIPEIKVTELFSLLTTMVQATGIGGGTGIDGQDDLEKLVLLPPPESEAKAKACLNSGGKEQPYKLGERIVVL